MCQFRKKSSVIQVSHELRSLLWESVPYVKLYRYNPKNLYPKLNGFGDNGKRKRGLVWFPCTVASVTPYTSTVHEIRNHPHNISSATGSLLVRAESCIAIGGGHFEQVL